MRLEKSIIEFFIISFHKKEPTFISFELGTWNCSFNEVEKCLTAYLLASSSRSLASNSLLGGYLGKLEGSQARGLVVKNWKGQLENKDKHIMIEGRNKRKRS